MSKNIKKRYINIIFAVFIFFFLKRMKTIKQDDSDKNIPKILRLLIYYFP